jgi:hypothetical protein
MKKIFLLTVLILTSKSSIAQEAFYTKTLKELIAFRTLIKENRISDLDKLIDESLYVGLENNSFVKSKTFDETVPDDMFVFFQINDDNDLKVAIGKTDENNSPKLKMTKGERNNIWNDFFSVIEVGLPYGLYKDITEQLEDKKGDSLQFEKISRYEHRHKVDGKYDWKTNKASNFTTMFSNEKAYFFTFMGPGQLLKIDIIIPKYDDKGWNDEVPPFFFVTATGLLESETMPPPINIPFFMSLKNFNDRIWADN